MQDHQIWVRRAAIARGCAEATAEAWKREDFLRAAETYEAMAARVKGGQTRTVDKASAATRQ